MADSIISQNSTFELLAPADAGASLAEVVLAELGRPGPRLDLQIEAKACRCLLSGRPGPAAFEPVELEPATILLEQMAATMGPEGSDE
jgi:hypothetical protein